MRWRLRHGTGLVAATALALTPVLTGAAPPVVDAAPRPASDWVDLLPNLPEEEGVEAHPPAPQGVEPQTTLVARSDRDRGIRVDGPRGSRVWTASALSSHDLPQAALEAYKAAAATMAVSDPSCRLPWTLLAGIGRVESDHGRYGGSVLSDDGVSRPAIIGIALDGRGPVAAIRDSDDGRLDRDKVWDRAVGPMQFIPTTWSSSGRDGDGDGVRNPHDLDDAALAAAGYLCSGSESVDDEQAAKAAIFRYNPSDAYVALVQAFERGYRTGVFVMPSPPPPSERDRQRPDRKRDAARTARESQQASPSRTPRPAGDTRTSAPRPSPTPTREPSPTPTPTREPSPTPTPTREPSPTAPALEGLTGVLSPCGDGWCVGATTLDLGPATQLGALAAHDYDRNGSRGTNAEELTGLAGTSVTVRVAVGTAVVYVLESGDYRNADGSFTR
ncbi:MAG TPA: lytic murein transglycosylase [Nocardioides sp.]|nr:lytic murein transglycosylase [Nocardioides sp.]